MSPNIKPNCYGSPLDAVECRKPRKVGNHCLNLKRKASSHFHRCGSGKNLWL